MIFARVSRVVTYGVAAWLLTCLIGAASPLARAAPPSPSNAVTAKPHRSLIEHLNRPLKDFTVIEYGSMQGAPSVVYVITQTPDGLLWLGCPDGLVRFDGVTFDRSVNKKLPKKNIKSLWVDADGSLWIGYTFGGVSRLHDGQVTNFERGLPHHSVNAMVRDASGTLWAATSYGTYHLVRDIWEKGGPDIGYDGKSLYLSAGVLDDGTLWIDSGNKAWLEKVGTHYFVAVDTKKLFGMIYHINDGRVSAKARVALEGIENSLLGQPFFLTNLIIKDASGALWSASALGLMHFRQIALKSDLKVLSIDPVIRSIENHRNMIYSLFQDREGNVWAAEVGGIVQFRPNKINSVSSPDDIVVPAISSDLHGGVWVGSNEDEGVVDVRGDLKTSWPSIHGATAFITNGRNGTTWFLSHASLENHSRSADYIHVIKDNKVARIAYPDRVSSSSAVSIVTDPRGGYLFSSARGIYRLHAGVWSPGTGLPGLPANPPLRLIPAANGDIWLAYADNRISVISKTGGRNYTKENGLFLGAVLAISVKHGNVWAAGTNGVEHLMGNRFVPLHAAGSATFESADGIVQTEQGDLWINASSGLFRVKSGEIHLVESDPGHKVRVQYFDQNDGLQGAVEGFFPGPSLVESGGRIWVARAQGVSWIDPRHIIRNEVAPIAKVVSIASDGVLHDATSSPRFPPLVHAVRLVYTAASLTRPDKVNFRYRLEGTDPGWIAVGDRRAITYTDLGPGTHRFEVEAENEDGAWSVEPGTASFTIAPAFYQTWWFRLLSASVLLLVLWILYAWRSRQLQARLQLRLEAVHDERERIARELHDTLMQSMQGLTLQVQAWAGDSRDERHLEMRRAAGSATIALREGRERILALRRGNAGALDLLSELRDTAEYLALRYPPVFDLSETGDCTELKPAVFKETLEVAREAIRNAAIHANSSQISVLIDYGKRSLSVSVSDNGDGLPAGILQAGFLPGHWGLVGMRERAKALGGQLFLGNLPQGGTQLRLVVPSALAYKRKTFRRWWRASRRSYFSRTA